MKSTITLRNCDQFLLEQLTHSDEAIAKELELNTAPNWLSFGKSIFQFSLDMVIANPQSVKWWTYLSIHIPTNTIIGSCGFKGPPNEHGTVAIGYEIAPSYRNQGLATQVVEQLIIIARKDKNVKKILAHTLVSNEASARVLEKCNFTFIEEQEDEDDGKIWEWAFLF